MCGLICALHRDRSGYRPTGRKELYDAALGGAREVYRYLLERSGLLREPLDGAVCFIHRTFQDYLAARAAVEDLDFDLLAKNAHLGQWADVIRMAVAHGRPAERAHSAGERRLNPAVNEPAGAVRELARATSPGTNSCPR